jgi:hypothetical protein
MDILIKHVLNDIDNTIQLNYNSVLKVIKKYSKYKDSHEFINKRMLNIEYKNGILTNKNKNIDKTNRHILLYKIFENAIEYIKKNNLILNDFNLFFYTGDNQLLTKKKINVFSISSTLHNMLLLDTSYISMSLEERYSEKSSYDWDGIKKIMKQHKYDKLINKIYFLGTLNFNKYQRKENPGTMKIRYNFYERLRNNKIFEFDLNNYKPVYVNNEYKYLLNLPGWGGWSSKLKYLYLTNGYVFDIQPILHFIDVDYPSHYPQNDIISRILLLNGYNKLVITIDFYQVYYDYNYKKYKNKLETLNNTNINKAIKQVIELYNKIEKGDNELDKEKENIHNLVSNLSLSDFYNYYYQIFRKLEK